MINSEKLLNLFFKNARACCVVLDRNFNFISVNEAFAIAENKPVDFFPGKNYFELYPSDAQQLLEDILDSKKPGQITAHPFIYPDKLQQSTTYWDWLLDPILDEQGEVEILALTLHDVTARVHAEQALEESEERFRRMSELSREAIVIHEQGTIRDINQAVTKMFGYSREELLGESLLLLATPESHALIRHRIKNKIDQPFEVVAVHKDGSKFPVHISVRSIQYGGREARCVVIHDNTEHKKIEDELRQHREHLQELVDERTARVSAQAKIIDQIRASVISTNLDGIVTSWNRGAEHMLGYTADEAIGKHIGFICPQHERAFWNEQFVALQIEGALDTEMCLHHKNGGEFFAHLYLSRMGKEQQDEQGHPQGMIVYAVDITEKKEAAQLLQESESKYRALFELSDDAITTIYGDRFVDCNQATLDMFGCASKEEFLGKHPSEVSPLVQADGVDSRTAADAHIAAAYAQGSSFFEWIHRRSSGEDFPTEVLLQPIELEGEEVLQVIIRDITERKRVEEAL